MAASDWLSFMPRLDLAAGTMTMSLWVAGSAAGLLVAFVLVAIFRVRTAVLGALVGAGVVAVVATSGVILIDRQDRAAERRQLETRLATLMASAVAPGSALGCLDGDVGEAVEGACERSVFANPESVAAA